jgi:hypothetical protein
VYFHLRPNLGMPTPKPSFMYILSNSGDYEEWYRNIIDYEIKPLLEELFFDDLKKAESHYMSLI